MVRDPIEKVSKYILVFKFFSKSKGKHILKNIFFGFLQVISWFYYIRAGWYLVTKKTTVPGYVFPDVEYLKMTFEECVEMSKLIYNLK